MRIILITKHNFPNSYKTVSLICVHTGNYYYVISDNINSTEYLGMICICKCNLPEPNKWTVNDGSTDRKFRMAAWHPSTPGTWLERDGILYV